MSAFGQYGGPFSNKTRRPKKMYAEVELPFDVISEDHVLGSELKEALTGQEVKNSLEDYSVFPKNSSSEYEIKAVKDRALPYSHPEETAPYISFEGEEADAYSHLRVELAAPDSEALNEIYDDLNSLEEGLNDYFEQNNMAPQTSSVAESSIK